MCLQNFELTQLTREEIIQHVRAGVMATHNDVMAIVIFGSLARDTGYRDMDVLVVVRGPQKPPLERGPEMNAIQQAIVLPLDVDVLIYSEAEALFGARLYDRCVTHCQQTPEKSVKAVLACFGRLERTHFGAAVLRAELEQQHLQSEGQHETLNQLADDAQTLEPAAIWSRYPREGADGIILPAERYDITAAEKGLAAAQRSLNTARTCVEGWFTPPDTNTTERSR